MPDSLKTYIDIYNNTDSYLKNTLKVDIGIVLEELKSSKRFFFTGSGSSAPAALYGSIYLIENTILSGIYVSSSYLLNNKSLAEGDVVFLISQGWSRADAYLITKKVLESNAKLIVLTGHPERSLNYTEEKRIQTLPLYPEEEKLFSRPSSVITGYALIAKIVHQLAGDNLNDENFLLAYENGKTYQILNEQVEKYVILGTSELMSAAYSICLALREGAGCESEYHEIESYGHGWYVQDQYNIKAGQKVKYIVLKSVEDYMEYSISRITPLLKGTNSNFEIWESNLLSVYANVEFMSRCSKLIIQLNTITGFDMNEPPGKEENRLFHEISNY